jgi:protein-tyrosine phosphatase
MKWEPILEGGKLPDVDWLKGVVGFIDVQRRAQRTVYVHCLAGVDRSATVVTAYLMFEHGWGRDTALAQVKSKRPCACPDPTLMQLLADWERTSEASKLSTK